MDAGGVNAWMRASYDQPDGLSGYGAGGHERFYVNGTWAVCKSGVAVGAAAQLALVPAFGLGVAAHAADSDSEEPPELVAEFMHAIIPPLRRLLAQLECTQSQIPDEAVQLLTAGPWGSAARGTVLTAQLAAGVGGCTLDAAMPTIFGVPSMGAFTLRTAHGVQASMIDLAQSVPAAPSVTRVVWTFRYMANATKLREILSGAESISCQRLTALGVPGLGFLLNTSQGMRLWLPGDDGNTLHTILNGSGPSPSVTSPPSSPPPPPPTAAEGDRVASIPGWSGPLPSPHYSGYVPVRGGSRQLHYYLQEAEEAAAEKPLVLWLQGGPTASSLLGAFVEVGQLVFTDDSYRSGRSVPRLFRNPYSYTAHANMLFLEQPVATGFSRCVDPTSPCESSDNSTAQESHEFLVGFFARFPEYATRPFYIMGESYAGMFTTWLMEEIWRQNLISVRGVSLGNACFGTAAGTNCGTIPKCLHQGSNSARTRPCTLPAPCTRVHSSHCGVRTMCGLVQVLGAAGLPCVYLVVADAVLRRSVSHLPRDAAGDQRGMQRRSEWCVDRSSAGCLRHRFPNDGGVEGQHLLKLCHGSVPGDSIFVVRNRATQRCVAAVVRRAECSLGVVGNARRRESPARGGADVRAAQVGMSAIQCPAY